MSDFSLSITNWYRLNKRDLPWRKTTDPYKIWLSEIILQQTRVDQGMSYYLKFVQNYPKVEVLAGADEQCVLNDWQGLGYYSRARNLHAAAKQITKNLHGIFPDNFVEIKKLKGVGDYTAAAIASFAFNEKKAVVDGNVYRVLSRVFDIATPIDSTNGKKEFQALADELIPAHNPAEHNQAIMEFGALICTPKPNCDACVLKDNCLAKEVGSITDRPVKSKKTKVRDRHFNYLIYTSQNKTIIRKRTEKDIWQNMYEFPLIESKTIPGDLSKSANKISLERKHILSHQKIHTTFYHFNFIPNQLNEDWILIEQSSLQEYPLPRLIDKYLEELDQED